MKKRLFALFGIIGSLALSGCSFFDIITSDSSTDTSYTPWEGGKQALTYTQKDLTNNNYYTNYDTMPASGRPKLLVVPIAFTNTSDFLTETDKASIKTDLEKLAFGTNEDTGWYSINSFYQAESYGKCIIEGEVADWYNCGYAYGSVNTSDLTASIVKAAVNDWKSKNPSKVRDFDSDGNGYLDGILAVYGCPNYKNTAALDGHKVSDNMWAYTSWMEDGPSTTNPTPNVFIWASYDFMDTDNTEGMTIDGHTYIHEMGHVLGLDDYYDYASDSEVWAGGFSMQDYNVGGHDPYSILCYGWADPYVPTSSSSITIKPFESSGDVILLSPDFSSNSAFDEYILIELYTPTGVNKRDSTYQYASKYPVGPDKAGIRVWHIDARLLKLTESTRRGKPVTSYTIVNTIDPDEGSYLVGCTNTTYIQGDPKGTNKYCSLVSELRDYKLVELIRRGDYMANKTDEYLSNNFLFKAGDTFSLKQYSGYFKNATKLNDGRRFNWSIRIDSVSNTSATISVIL